MARKINGIDVIESPLDVKDCIEQINRVSGGGKVKAEYHSLIDEHDFICRVAFLDGTDDISSPDKNGVEKEAYLRLSYSVDYDSDGYPEISPHLKGINCDVTDYGDIRENLESDFAERYCKEEGRDVKPMAGLERYDMEEYDDVKENVYHESMDFINRLSEEAFDFGYDTLGEAVKVYLNHYCKTGVSSLVAEDLRNFFVCENEHDWETDKSFRESVACAKKLIAIAKSEDKAFADMMDEWGHGCHSRDIKDALIRGVAGYVADNYEDLQFVVAYNLVNNGYTDKYLEDYAKTIMGGYVLEVIKDDKSGKASYDTKEELSHLRKYVNFYAGLDVLVAEREEKMQTIEKNDVAPHKTKVNYESK